MKKPFRSSGRRSGRLPVHSPTGATPPGRSRLCRCIAAALAIAAVVLPCAVLYQAAIPRLIRRTTWNPTETIPLAGGDDDLLDPIDLDREELRLQDVLKEAAMKDRTVILTTLNAAWALPNSVIDLFIESFRIGDGTNRLLNHVVIIALDQKAYSRCMSVHMHCFPLRTEGVDFSGEKNFMSSGYLAMMWRRIDFLREILEMGYSFIFTDVDVMWFRNPLPHFYPDGDFQIACDHFTGNATDLENRPNGGFNYVKSNNQTIEFYKFWYSSRERHPGYHDQDVLNFIKYDPFIDSIGLRMRFLSTVYFGGICESSRNFNEVCTMHANCCIGLSSKLHDLRVMLQDWREYMSLPPTAKKHSLSPWRVPQNCSLSSLSQYLNIKDTFSVERTD